MADLPDFLLADNINHRLRRSDLGPLRRGTRSPTGIPADDIAHAIAVRLVGNGLLIGSLRSGIRFAGSRAPAAAKWSGSTRHAGTAQNR